MEEERTEEVEPESVEPKTDASDKPLSQREQLFVIAYCGNGYNGLEAFKTAGYPAKTDGSRRVRASFLRRQPNIMKAIEKRRAEIQTKLKVSTELDREYVMNNLRDIVETAKLVDAVKCDGKTVSKYQPNAAVRALELIGKEVAGMFVERTADVTDSIREREAQVALIKKAIALTTEKPA